MRSARADIGVFIQRRSARVVGRSNGRSGDFTIEPLSASAPEAEETEGEDDTDDNETDDDKNTSDGASVVEERAASSTSVRSPI